MELTGRSRTGPGPTFTGDEDLEALLDEARLDPDTYGPLLERSLLTALARNAAAAAGVDASSWAHQTASTRSAGVEACWSPMTSRPGWRSEA